MPSEARPFTVALDYQEAAPRTLSGSIPGANGTVNRTLRTFSEPRVSILAQGKENLAMRASRRIATAVEDGEDGLPGAGTRLTVCPMCRHLAAGGMRPKSRTWLDVDSQST